MSSLNFLGKQRWYLVFLQIYQIISLEVAKWVLKIAKLRTCKNTPNFSHLAGKWPKTLVNGRKSGPKWQSFGRKKQAHLVTLYVSPFNEIQQLRRVCMNSVAYSRGPMMKGTGSPHQVNAKSEIRLPSSFLDAIARDFIGLVWCIYSSPHHQIFNSQLSL